LLLRLGRLIGADGAPPNGAPGDAPDAGEEGGDEAGDDGGPVDPPSAAIPHTSQ
jgi:hypothetical protein